MRITLNIPYLAKDDIGRAYLVKPTKKDKEYGYRCIAYRVNDGDHWEHLPVREKDFVAAVSEEAYNMVEKAQRIYKGIIADVLEPTIRENIDQFD